MFFKQDSNVIRIKKLQPVQILAAGFLIVILVGAMLLMMPISSKQRVVTSFINCLFTSTSAVCVTGLVAVDTGTYWSVFGQVVIMLLIQVGGLGFMTFAVLFSIILGRRITLKERLIMQEAYNIFDIQGVVKLALYVMGITFTIEGIGAALLASQFIKDYGWGKGIYFGIFHAVSAFCNAGFDLIGNFKNMTPYVENPVVSLTICGLIIIGGIGFYVLTDVLKSKNFKKLTLHSKVALITTAFLLITGSVLFFIFEHNNPLTMGKLSFNGKILASIFASTTPRTAGFNSVSTTDMTTASKFLTIILMFIGASPGSTGGGIKTTTAALIFLTIVSVIKGREDTEVSGKKISKSIIYKAAAIVSISFALVIFVTLILCITEKGDFIQFLYEATSAFGTVGLSLDLSPKLSIIGKIIISATMYSGRVGPLTLALAISNKQNSVNNSIKYPEDKILVG